MRSLIAVNNPFPGIGLIEIFEPGTTEGRLVYPVKIDLVMVDFTLGDDGRWKPLDPAAAIAEEVAWFTGDLIEQQQNP